MRLQVKHPVPSPLEFHFCKSYVLKVCIYRTSISEKHNGSTESEIVQEACDFDKYHEI